MSAEGNKALVRRYMEEAFEKRSSTIVDELVAPEFVHHDPVSPIHGPEELKQLHGMFFAAFPDMRLTVEDMIAEADKVVTRWTIRGTHQGDLLGIPPTGKSVIVTGMVISRLKDGKFVEDWEKFDTMGLMQQLGVIP